MADIQKYLDNITPQHRCAPRFNAWLAANLNRAAETDDAASGLRGAFDVGVAVGEQLGTLIDIAGIDSVARGYDDGVLRRLLMARIIKNQWDGCLGSIADIWRAVFGDEFTLVYADHQDMSVTLSLTGDRPTDFLKIMLFRDALPKPAGVRLTVCLRTEALAKVRLVACGAVVYSYFRITV